MQSDRSTVAGAGGRGRLAVIGIDASVCIKWFKSGERYDAEAQDLRQRLAPQEVEAVASEIISLEIVRGLKKAQVQQPALGITDSDIDAAQSVPLVCRTIDPGSTRTPHPANSSYDSEAGP
jgi:hypothetical protein